MTFLKSLWTDLVEKRLWPVALALVLALVAIPVLLGGGGDAATTSPLAGVTGATGADAVVAQVALDTPGPDRRDRLGKLRDPFKQPPAPATGTTGAASVARTSAPAGAVATAKASAGPGAASTATTAPATGTTGGSSAPAVPAVPASPAAPKGSPRDAYLALVRFGTTGSKRPTRRLARLTPLPSADNPWFVDLGVTASDKVVFLLSEGVAATGDGTCRPSKASCESVELEKGDTEFFDVTSESGEVTQYQLDLRGIDKG